jgi:hypothetical protein
LITTAQDVMQGHLDLILLLVWQMVQHFEVFRGKAAQVCVNRFFASRV